MFSVPTTTSISLPRTPESVMAKAQVPESFVIPKLIPLGVHNREEFLDSWWVRVLQAKGMVEEATPVSLRTNTGDAEAMFADEDVAQIAAG